MKIIAAILFALVLALQYRLWVAEGGMREVRHLRSEVAVQLEENERLAVRNRALVAEVQDLKRGRTAVEERARTDLGMIGPRETFFQVVPAADTEPAMPEPRE